MEIVVQVNIQGFRAKSGRKKYDGEIKCLRVFRAHSRIFSSFLFIALFDEEERILIVSFLPKSLSRVLWTSAAGIDRDAMRFQRLGAILDWLTDI